MFFREYGLLALIVRRVSRRSVKSSLACAARIDWRPFFLTWELRGRFPDILTDSKLGEPATALFRDAQELLDRIIQEDLLKANAVVGFFPANSVGDDI